MIMKNILVILFSVIVCVGVAQTRITENVIVSDQTLLDLDFPFADDIIIKAWDRNEVKVDVDVTINGGDDDDIFQLETDKNSQSISIRLDKDLWKESGKGGSNCNWNSELFYTVYLPSSLRLKAKTINGNFILEPYGEEVSLQTISGDIDITIHNGLDFKAKTISGEIFSDLDIEYPDGKEGLKQIVGMNVKGRVSDGGPVMNIETISGNIYLRKG